MSRVFLSLLPVVALLSACGLHQDRHSPEQGPACPKIEYAEGIYSWLELQQAVDQLSLEVAKVQLEYMRQPENIHDRYLFGLLNQRMVDPVNWKLAWDTFNDLSGETELTEEQRLLVDIFKRFNEDRVSSYHEYTAALGRARSAEAELESAQEEATILEQKIDAITDLETTISNRKD